MPDKLSWLSKRIGRRARNDKTFSFEQVLTSELETIDGKRNGHKPAPEKAGDATPDAAATEASGPGVFQRALDQDLVGLAFSGGGIRSATFNLGVLQALADLGLLRYVDYLSTVSGGGYIGSWLSALIHREHEKQVAANRPNPDGVGRVEEILQTRRSFPSSEAKRGTPHDHGTRRPREAHEHDAIRFLRQYSNFLTPRVGLFSADTWSVAVTYVRNLTLNLTLLAAGLAVLLLLPRGIVAVADVLTTYPPLVSQNRLLWACLAWAVALGGWAMFRFGYSLAALTAEPQKESRPWKDANSTDTGGSERRKKPSPWTQQPAILEHVVLPLVLTAILMSGLLQSRLPQDLDLERLDWVILMAVVYGSAWALAFLGALRSPWAADLRFRDWPWLLGSAFLSGGLAGYVLPDIRDLLNGGDAWSGWVLGPPALLVWMLLLGFVHTGLLGTVLRDQEREWLSRAAGWLSISATAWAGWFSVCVYGPAAWSAMGSWQGVTVTGWAVATILGLLIARRSPAPGSSGRIKPLLLTVVPYVFAAGLLILLTVGLDQTFSPAEDTTFQHPLRVWMAILALLGVAAVLALRIDVNEFSMHGLYRNRLVRAFLGATLNPEDRQLGRLPFTSFHADDDLELRALRDPRKIAPIHLLNTAVNLVSGQKLTWQDRKAASFILSPLYCGFDAQTNTDEIDPEPRGDSPGRNDAGAGASSPELKRYGYRKTLDGYGSNPVPLTLGSAMAISGAAASPHMGFRSTPALAFLLTIFNVRLGWWIGNPWHPDAWQDSGPRFALGHLFMELFGKAGARDKYVYLSDGEHFENLGIYELVRRRCRFIIASDVGADPDYAFENLGNAIRKCRSDFGIEIEIDVDPLRPDLETGFSPWHCAVGKITYPMEGGGSEEGVLLYLKASLTGDEPRDVLSYARAEPPFPHQTTADQFFDEAQFESYRTLGHHAALEVLKDAADVAKVEDRPRQLPLEKLLVALSQRWHAPSSTIAQAFTRHARHLDRLFEQARATPELAFLDAQIYPEWHRLLDGAERPAQPAGTRRGLERTETLWLPRSEGERRQGFYFCNSLIQLMESVYLDLDLDLEHGHPDNRGWMNLFKHWTWSGMFRATWAISASTYGHRFESFCHRHLGLELGKVRIDELWEPEEAPRRTPIDFDGFLEAVEDRPAFLNFLEREQVEMFLRHGQAETWAVCNVVHFELRVEGHTEAPAERGELVESAEDILSFGFGYALLDAEGRVRLFRIQDHLRAMGLGRKALLELRPDARHLAAGYWSEITRAIANVAEVARPDGPRAPGSEAETPERERLACERFAQEFGTSTKGFASLLRSVRRELDEEPDKPPRRISC